MNFLSTELEAVFTRDIPCAAPDSVRPNYVKPSQRLSYLEFFAGSGLVAEGLKSHFHAAWANDICEKKAAVYAANHGAAQFHLGSISDVFGKDLPEVPLAWASFPCQDLSVAGAVEGIHGARSGLVWEWLRIISEMPVRPRVLVAENVAGLLSTANGAHYRTLHQALIELGYNVGTVLINALHWVPQSRPRVFVIAVRVPQNEIPAQLVSGGPSWLHPDLVRKVAVSVYDWIWWHMPEPAVRQRNFSDIVDWDAPYASEVTEARNAALIAPKHREFLNRLPSTKRFAAPGYKRTRSGGQVLELRFDDIAGCLRTPKGGSSRQIVVIKDNGTLRSRLLTVRETARLMGAPESYKIPGSYNDGYQAMGDAVAVPVVEWLAKHLLFPLANKNG
jgi:DNA (cytosine-5)-methyltransferase 1